MDEPINVSPTILETWQLPKRKEPEVSKHTEFDNLSLFSLADIPKNSIQDEEEHELIDAQEIYDLTSLVYDPEHPLTLGQLAVVNLDKITVKDSSDPNKLSTLHLEITPTITHCSLATLIGLGLKVRLDRALPAKFRVHLTVTPGSHQSEDQVNRQLNDKERVAAACENEQLMKVVEGMLANC